MRTATPLPRPRPEHVAHGIVHELVRDLPELLGEFRARGIDPRRYGGASVDGLADADSLRTMISTVTAWRPEPA